MKRTLMATVAAFLCLYLTATTTARTAPDVSGAKDYTIGRAAASPVYCLAAHRIGRMELAIANNGTFGNYYFPGNSQDWFTGQPIPLACQYPKNSNIQYMYGGAFWIGAVVGRDTLVSFGADGWTRGRREFHPDEAPFGEMIYRSITDPTAPEFENAVSEEDYVCAYTDTLTNGVPNDFFGRAHIPLNIEVTQSSFAWSYSYAEDFVLFDYQIRNSGTRLLENVYMGIYVDADVCFDCQNSLGYADDICGFLHTYPSNYGGCDYLDTVNLAWIADDDGDLGRIFNDGGEHPCPHITGTRIVRTPADSLDVSFNWWISNVDASQDFGPRERAFVGRLQEDFRDFRTGGLGTPEGDVNKYYTMRNQEFDYDQAYAAQIQPNDSLWLYPDQSFAPDVADGFDTRYFLSFGPFDIRPGQTLPISFAYVAGEDFHTDENNAANNLPDNPDQYYAGVDFSDLALNYTWASWVYDNPGVDTDGDGDSGKVRICCLDSIIASIDTLSVDPLQTDTLWTAGECEPYFYEGDGIPDFRGAAPPPPPDFWLTANAGSITVRFNGLFSETSFDVFSHTIDFEGYRVYLARDERASSYSLVASYDRENYNKMVYNPNRRPEAGYELLDVPFTVDSLRCLYGDSCGDMNFDPLAYTPGTPYIMPDSQFYFEAQDYNASELGVNTPIRKIYPHQPYPSSLNPDSARPDELTEDGYLRYFEYEIVIEDLLATVPFWVAVTAFDYGSPESGLASLETSVTANTSTTYAQPGWDEVQQGAMEVIVYPNPYLLSGGYRNDGFEGRTDQDRPPDRTREIHFANLAPECTIKIFTLDGDLVREIQHDDGTTHETWDMISRNTQMVVTGLYYWTVESSFGETQIGKLAIIM